MAKAKKLPSGNWRVNQYVGKDETGKRKFESFTADTKKEAEYMAAEYMMHKKKRVEGITVGDAIDNYIASKNNILSPTTISGYQKIRRNNMKNIMDVALKNVDSRLVQVEINREAAFQSPKSIRNSYSLLNSALVVYMPELRLNLTFPAKIRKNKELVMPQDIIKLVRGTSIELPVMLAMWMGLRMSEILGIKKSDITGNRLFINRVKVYVDKQYIIKEQAKTFESNRSLRLPDYLLELIGKVDFSDDDFIIADSGRAIYARFVRLLKNNGLPHMKFHDLRHLNASVMVKLGIPDKYAMERGGWKTDDVMKSVYQHTFSSERDSVDDKIDEYFQHEIQHAFL